MLLPGMGALAASVSLWIFECNFGHLPTSYTPKSVLEQGPIEADFYVD